MAVVKLGLNNTKDQLESLSREQATHLRDLAAELTHAEQHERDRFFTLLHDDVQPLLVATRLSLSGVNASTSPETYQRITADACEHIGQALRVARTLGIELSPPLILERGLIPALESLCHWVNENHGLKVDLTTMLDAESDDRAIRLNCFNAVRELLLNVVKHASTTHASIDLQVADRDVLRITVSDGGIGFDPSCANFGTGLAGIERRMKMLGGSLEINSQSGQTIMTINVPRSLGAASA